MKKEQTLDKTMEDLHQSIEKDLNMLRNEFNVTDHKKLQERIDLKVANLTMLREKKYGTIKKIRHLRVPGPQPKEEIIELMRLIE